MSALPKPRFTPEEYLELEDKAAYKSEYVHGEIFAMAGTWPAHNQVLWALASSLRRHLAGRPCNAFFMDIRLRAAQGEMYTYPDAMVLCGGAKYFTPKAQGIPNLLNPQVIIEILSSSTEAYDRGEKFHGYRQIESVTDYVLVSAERVQVEQYTRQPSGIWHYQAFDQPTDLLKLTSVGCEIPLAEVYEEVVFGEGE